MDIESEIGKDVTLRIGFVDPTLITDYDGNALREKISDLVLLNSMLYTDPWLETTIKNAGANTKMASKTTLIVNLVVQVLLG